MAKWLVIGGAGFIGSHIAEKLVKMGEKVRILDNFSEGKMEYLANVRGRVEVMRGDIRNRKAVDKAVKGMQYVLNQAALRSVPRSVEEPEECNDINITGTLNCLLASKKARVKRFVLASSSSIYGDATIFPQKESHLPAPISPYAASKIAGEHYCNVFRTTYGLSTVALRYFNVFGPRQDPKSRYAVVIPKFILLALADKPLEMHWDGKQSRDFTYVEDVAQANIRAATAARPRQLAYNVGCGNSTSLLDIAHAIEKFIGHKLKINFHPKRAGDVRKTWGDITAIKRDLGFRPDFPFAKGLKETYRFFAEDDRWKDYL